MMIQRKILTTGTILIIAIVVLAGFTSAEWLTEPPSMPLYNASKFSYSVPANSSLVWLNKGIHNVSQFGSHIEIGYHVSSDSVFNFTNFGDTTGPYDVLTVNYWVWNESLGFPFTGFAFKIDSLSLSTNATFFKNLPTGATTNVLPYLFLTLKSGFTQGTLSHYLPASIMREDQSFNYDTTRNAYYISIDYTLMNSFSKPYSTIINNGTFRFNFTSTIVPVFEVGPYYFYGSDQILSYSWTQTIIA